MSALARLMIAAAGSGCGKTSVTCALLSCLQTRSVPVSAFKCGPDYIDPLFHQEVLGLSGCNLDLFLSDESTVRGLMAHYSAKTQLAVIEGVMGYYDGIGGTTDMASSYDLANATQTPVLLLVDPRGMSLSLAALIAGFRDFRQPSHIAGVLLNHCSEALYTLLRPVIEEQVGLKVFGYLPDDPEFAWESRHLGLDLRQRQAAWEGMQRMAAQMERTVDVNGLLAVARSAPPLEPGNNPLSAPLWASKGEKPVWGMSQASTEVKPQIAVAMDEAFCFIYRENIDMLRTQGAEIVPFSPLRDQTLPDGVGGLYLCGGYPESYAAALAENETMRHSIREAAMSGLPTIAECGGFLYLQQTLEGEDGEMYPMVGLLDGVGMRSRGARRFGYLNMTARRDSLFATIGESWRAHEFHYWDCDRNGMDFDCAKPLRDLRWHAGYAQGRLLAGFPHLYFPGAPQIAARFVRLAKQGADGE